MIYNFCTFYSFKFELYYLSKMLCGNKNQISSFPGESSAQIRLDFNKYFIFG